MSTTIEIQAALNRCDVHALVAANRIETRLGALRKLGPLNAAEVRLAEIAQRMRTLAGGDQ